jgi:hypothetical protein
LHPPNPPFKSKTQPPLFALNVSATQELYHHKIIIEPQNEINDLKTTIARIEAIINSSLTVDG